jgi:hypothetical protein
MQKRTASFNGKRPAQDAIQRPHGPLPWETLNSDLLPQDQGSNITTQAEAVGFEPTDAFRRNGFDVQAAAPTVQLDPPVGAEGRGGRPSVRRRAEDGDRAPPPARPAGWPPHSAAARCAALVAGRPGRLSPA